MADLTRRKLHQLVWSRPMKAAAEGLGLSPNGLAKICDRMLVPYPTRGHWSKPQDQRAPKVPLPRNAALDQQPVVIVGERAASRRLRTRLSPQARRAQLLDAAMRIAGDDGIGAVSLKRVAREVGVSEALAFGYFRTRAELLAAVARRELDAMRDYQRAEIARGETVRSRVALSTIAYLRQIEARGSTLHMLLTAPEVRLLLRPERQSRQARGGASVSARFAERSDVPADFAYGATQALTAAARRAGRLLAMGKLPRERIEALILAIIEQGNRDLAAAAKASPTPLAGPLAAR